MLKQPDAESGHGAIGGFGQGLQDIGGHGLIPVGVENRVLAADVDHGLRLIHGAHAQPVRLEQRQKASIATRQIDNMLARGQSQRDQQLFGDAMLAARHLALQKAAVALVLVALAAAFGLKRTPEWRLLHVR